MSKKPTWTSARRKLWLVFLRDRNAASAIEFALVVMPFILLLLFILQIGIYYMMQISLDNGVLRSAEDLRAQFSTGKAPVLLSGSSLKASIVSYAGRLITNSSALSVEVQPLANLDGAVVPITDGLTNYGSANVVLAIRAQYSPASFMPSFNATVTANSSALIRRQSE